MGERIFYELNYEKAIETIVWLANKKPKIDIYHIAKILYYSEKLHINKYARPIIGDTYIRMPFGQVPSGVRDLITGNSWSDPDYLKILLDSVEIISDRNKNMIALREPRLEMFSKTDIECLEECVRKYFNLPFNELKEMSHEERSWIETEMNQPIDYALMVDDDNPNRDEILEEMSNTSRYIRL